MGKKNILKPYGKTDVLLYYSAIARKLEKYLKGKEIAAKNHLGKAAFMPFILKRGSKISPLMIEEFREVNESFLKTRKEIKSLKDAKNKITKTQAKLWEYFLPRKLSELFYATNNEGAKRDIERVFLDIDSNVSKEQTQKATKELINIIKADKSFNKRFKCEIFIMWTGKSFHIYIFLNKKIKNNMYNSAIAYSKADPKKGFIGKWAAQLQKKFKFKISGGHEKIPRGITIDPSQTPSGKLCRAPFSLHLKNEKTVDGIAIPVTIKDLSNPNLIKTLQLYTPDRIIKDIDKLSAKLLKKHHIL